MNNEEDDEHETNKKFQNEEEEENNNNNNNNNNNQKKAQEEQQQQLNTKSNNNNNLLTKWQTIINSIRKPIIQTLQTLSGQAATHPILTISIIIIISLSFIIIGFMTNFRIEVDSDKLWVPQDSRGAKFIQWVESNDESGFPDEPVTVGILVYAEEDEDDEEGKTARSVLDLEGMEKVFDVVDFMKSVEGYYDICPEEEEKNDCNWRCATEIWSSRSEFETSIQTDEDLINALSSPVYADGKPIYRPRVFGTPHPIIRDVVERTNGNYTLDDIRLKSAKSYLCALSIPTDPDLEQSEQPTYELEKLFIDGLRKMDEEWTDSGSDYHVRVFSGRSFDDEFNRSIQRDIPLMVIAFVIMGNFCSFFFFRCKDRVNSQSMVGLGAVVSVLLALMTCYGFMFCIGVPFTSLTQIFPFIMVGIGLDDAFIIMGYFTRTDQRNSNNGNNNVVDRVSQMIEEAGMSITVSTFTTFLAFMLSSMNSIPAVRWFCYYAAPCIIIDFIYAITFFVAILVLDDRRIKSRRWDAACCIKSKQQQQEEEEQQQLEEEEEEPKRQEAIAEKVMDIYAKVLLKPVTKVIVLVVFATTFVLLSIAASRLTQAFNFMDLTPKDSYVDQYFDALDETATGDSDGMLWISVYFRDVDFSTNETQDAMYSYLSDLQDLHFVTYPPSHFWLDDFKTFLSNNNTNTTLQTSPFNTQIDTFLSTPPYNELYSDHIVRDTQTKTITASRTFITFDQIDRLEVEQQMNAFIDQEQVGHNQPINQNRQDWAFFTVGPIYGLWEFYSIIVGELTLSTILGIVSVFIISLLFIPHPVGSLVVTPTVMMIYIELLGVLHIAGLHINSVTSIALVMAIGLVVDYSMHIVFTFFEVHGIDRNEKVREVLKTMGMSVMVGGFTTFLGVLPLSFSQSEIFWTFFVSFLGIVSLGVGHGLVFVPVVLSLVGPMYSVKKNKEEEEEDDDEGDEED